MNDLRVLFIDNFDSFTYNLVDDFCKRGCEAKVYRADTSIEEIVRIAGEYSPHLVILSPGPGSPENSGVSLDVLGYFKDKLPIFGVCLGHQVITHYFGGKVGHAPETMHGKPSKISHDGKGVFCDMENPLQVGRYHSLSSIEVPDCLEVTAAFEDVVMAIKHRDLPIYGVQFHPESILTPAGGKLIDNILKIAAENNQ